ncbi:MAG TPA: ScyD/ScyE family protein [Vicinamibacterales bacterium]|nr:ScyD/ScyE family protein [Vicinamibacterales bacterium]
MTSTRKLLLLSAALIASMTPAAASAPPHPHSPKAALLVSGLEGGSGSTIGPDGALYVTEGIAGRISRVDPRTGDVSTFATGLPKRVGAIGGAMDVAFIGKTAFALVTLVGPDAGGTDVVGIYRVDGRRRVSVVADIGAFALSHPPSTPFFVPTGVQYAMEPYRGGFLVTDGHHNRVLHVTLDGHVSVLIAFDNIVPTGLARSSSLVFVAQAGPVPHLPENGRIVVFGPRADAAIEVASGARLLVDVEFGPGLRLYALSQGDFVAGNPEGSPAEPNTGSLVKVNSDGSLGVITDGLNQPTSLEFIRDTAYVVTLGGEIWAIDHVSHGRH